MAPKRWCQRFFLEELLKTRLTVPASWETSTSLATLPMEFLQLVNIQHKSSNSTDGLFAVGENPALLEPYWSPLGALLEPSWGLGAS